MDSSHEIFRRIKKLNYEGVYLVKKRVSNEISFDLNEGIVGNSNSGLGAMMLAIALGANPIYLLGYDMYIKGDRTHWHEGYPNQDRGKIYDGKLKKYIRRLKEFAPQIEEKGVKIINLNPESALKCFSFDILENVL